MREILFRGKKESNGEWVQGYFRKRQIVWGDKEYPKRIIEYLISWYSSEMSRWFEVKVDKHTISQYTGLTDKNGKKIFEGDIIVQKCWRSGVKLTCLVEWDNIKHGYQRKVIQDGVHLSLWAEIDKFTVIGNKWDNPELLEESDNGISKD